MRVVRVAWLDALDNDFGRAANDGASIGLPGSRCARPTTDPDDTSARLDMDILNTERLQLRAFTRADLDDLATILADAEVMRFSLMSPKSREETRSALESILAAYDKHGFGLYAVVHAQDRKLIGYCGFVVREVDGRREIELGCGLAPSYWGRGFATEALKACRDYGFRKLGFERLISIVDPRNIASIRVAEKAGMSLEKTSAFEGSPLHIYGMTRGGSDDSQ